MTEHREKLKLCCVYYSNLVKYNYVLNVIVCAEIAENEIFSEELTNSPPVPLFLKQQLTLTWL